MGAFWILVSALGAIAGLAFFLGTILLMIRAWDTLGQASEFYARENERFRREYERRRNTPA